MSGWFPADSAARLVCAARSWQCWPASAPSTTCDSSGDAPNIRPLRFLTRSRGRCSWTPKPRGICTTWPPRQGGDTSELEAAAHGLAEVIDQFLMPAIVVNRYRDVLAANPIARALSPEFTPGQNSLRWRLLDPAARELYVDWDEATEIVVSGLRELSGSCPKDPRMQALIAELSDASPRFRELWDRAEVGYRLGIHHMRHPQVGELYLHRHRLNAPYPGGDHVLMYRAEPGSPSAMALEELRSLSMRELGRPVFPDTRARGHPLRLEPDRVTA